LTLEILPMPVQRRATPILTPSPPTQETQVHNLLDTRVLT
jgi:hypothetical protein